MIYYAVKTFKTFNQAIDEVMKSSYSLSQSDLCWIRANDFSEVQDSIEAYYDAFEPSSYGEPTIAFGRTHYNSTLTENFNLAEESEEEKENGFETFYYSTVSRINDVKLRELKSGGEIIGYETIYSVMSEKPLEYSSAIGAFRKAGWQCSERAYELSEEEELKIKEEYEKGLIEDMRRQKSIPDLYFDVDFFQAKQDAIPYVSSHCMLNNSNTIENLLKSHPELADEIIKIIDEQIARMDEIEIPTTYDYNESIYENSDFYTIKRDEIRKTLMEIRNNIVAKKAKEAITAREEEISFLQEEERTIAEAEKLIELDKDRNVEKGIGE